MSKIENLVAEPETVEVLGEEFMIHPLEGDELLKVMMMSDKGSDREAITQLVVKTLQKDDEDVTRSEVLEAPAALFMKTMQKLQEVNGLEDFFDEAEIEEAYSKQE